MNTPEFSHATPRSQLLRLRVLAGEALKLYAIRIKTVDFINHGENTTFKVTAFDKKKYLLRIHRDDYHGLEGLKEELQWLAHLSRKKIARVPSPLRSKRGRWVEIAESPRVGSRRVSVLRWIEGRILDRRISLHHAFKIGELLGKLQANPLPRAVRRRPRWDAEGLLGDRAVFGGSFDRLQDLSAKERRQLERYRIFLFKKAKAFQKKYPRRVGLIHADLHLGNLVWQNGEFAAIDFDDCGTGFYAYDLVMAMIEIENIFWKDEVKKDKFKKILIDGYRSQRPWDAADDEFLKHLLNIRSLVILRWLLARSDNPRLAKHIKPRLKRVLPRLAREYGF
jgi:Ser/Thr protein kinase RdoA (MazF antagonist)